MLMTKRSIRMGAWALTITLGVCASSRAADAPTKTVTAEGMSFTVPESWKSTPIGNTAMRKAQLSIAAAEGDKAPAELVLFVFPQGVGTVEANIERWVSQFKGEGGAAVKPKIEKKQGKNVPVTVVELNGRYVTSLPTRIDEPNYRMLGAIVDTGKGSYILKLTGPDATVSSARSAFDKLVASIEVK